MNKSESIVNLATALAKAQSHIGAATKGTVNPFFRANFASLGSVMEAVKSPLLDQGISVLQPVGRTPEGQTYVETIVIHESGEFISDQMLVSPTKANDPQAQGSAISYARRYSLQSMLFVPAVDDDGEAAMSRPQSTAKHVAAKVEPKPESKVEPAKGPAKGYWKTLIVPSGSNKGTPIGELSDESIVTMFNFFLNGKGFESDFSIAIRDAAMEKELVDCPF